MDGNVLRDIDDGIVVPANRRHLEDLSPHDRSAAGRNTFTVDVVGLKIFQAAGGSAERLDCRARCNRCGGAVRIE